MIGCVTDSDKHDFSIAVQVGVKEIDVQMTLVCGALITAAVDHCSESFPREGIVDKRHYFAVAEPLE